MSSTHSEHSGDESSDAGGGSEQSSTAEYDQESFETYQHKVIQLCRDIGFGEPTNIERMNGGSYNRIIGLEFGTSRKANYILRIPRSGVRFDQQQEIKDQVATLHYASQFVPVASIAAFDSTQNNVLESAYVLQQRLPGSNLEKVFYDLPLAEKLQVTTKVAELMVEMESIKLDAPGRVVASDGVPKLQYQQIASQKSVKIVGYRSARFGISKQFPSLDEQGFTSLIRVMLEHRIRVFIGNDEPWMVEKIEMLQKIASQMEKVGLVRTADKYCTLWHWDFAARNIMISRASATPIIEPNSVPGEEIDGNRLFPGAEIAPDPWVITGVLDWDGMLSVPRILTRSPPLWLWCNEDERSSAWSGNFDAPPARELTQDELLIKAHFDQIMAKASPSYMEDAYFRGPWLRRLARFALFGFSEYGCFERYDTFVKDWENHLSTITGNRDESSEGGNDHGEEAVEGSDLDDDGKGSEGSADDSEHGENLERDNALKKDM